MLHAKLVSSDPTGVYTGEIAESWTWTAPTTLTVRLRPGLTFSNGEPITAQDAVWSLCRLIKPTIPYYWLFSNVNHTTSEQGSERVTCTGLRARDDTTMEIEVTSDPSRLLPALASSSAAIVPASSTPGEFGAVPGAGPYVVEHIFPNSRVVLKARIGGPLRPHAERVVFQLFQDDATAAALFKAGKLDALEIYNPTLYRLLVDRSGKLTVPGRLVGANVDQVRLLIFNRAAITRALGLTENNTQRWIRSVAGNIDIDAMAQRFEPLAIPMKTSFFPARSVYARTPEREPIPAAHGELLIITENDPYSDTIASMIPQRLNGAIVRYVGLEKAVLVSRLLKKEFDIASITLEAMMAHSAYWLSFFTPGSPFTVFGTPLEGLKEVNVTNLAALKAIAKQIDEGGNWLMLFQERHYFAFQPRIFGETFLATGLINYATIGVRQ
jgi:ABC-type transport system substrate-binding protein